MEVYNNNNCGCIINAIKRYATYDKDDCWDAVLDVYNQRCYWKWQEHQYDIEKEWFDDIEEDVHKYNWLYIVLVIVGAVLGSFLITLLLGYIMHYSKKFFNKKDE